MARRVRPEHRPSQVPGWTLGTLQPPPGLRGRRSPLEWPSRREWVELYVRSAGRCVRRYGVSPRRCLGPLHESPIFVVGSPRSGTTFTAETLGRLPGFADLGELRPLKRVIPLLVGQPVDTAADTIRTIVSRAQRCGQVAGLRPIEQSPECALLIPALARAYPEARFLHLVRDGRDVAASLIALGWLGGPGIQPRTYYPAEPLGIQSLFWVEPGRAAQYAMASAATRAAWVWRRCESAARETLTQLPGRSIEIRYERLVEDPRATSRELAGFLGWGARAPAVAAAFASTVASARGRWRRELGAAQLADVMTEAGDLLTELGYVD